MLNLYQIPASIIFVAINTKDSSETLLSDELNQRKILTNLLFD